MPLGNFGWNNNNGEHEKREWKPPFTEEELASILIEKLSSNYEEKFGQKHVPAKNVFSVSTLVNGPGTAVGNRKRTLAAVNVETGEEAKIFNMAMFRGSAIHKYSEFKLPDWHSYGSETGTTKKLFVREVIPYEWQDGVTKGIEIIGHPDFVKDDIVLELKTISATEPDLVKRAKYKMQVLRKAKFQAGCYAKILSHEIRRHYFAYVVTLDEEPNRHPITDVDKTAGFVMINDGKFKLMLNEKMLKRGYVSDSHLRVYSLSEDEAWHGMNYVKWSAREAVKILENDEAGIVSTDEVSNIGPLGKQN